MLKHLVYTVHYTHSAAPLMNAPSQTAAALTLKAGRNIPKAAVAAHTEYHLLYLGDLQPFYWPLNTCIQFSLRLFTSHCQNYDSHTETECTGGKPTAKSIGTPQHQGAHSTTMQMRVSLGEEGSGAVVEKHVGLGHSNVHLRRIVTVRHKSSPILAVYLCTSKFKTTDKQVEGEESCSFSSHYMTATGQSHCTLMHISSEITTDLLT